MTHSVSGSPSGRLRGKTALVTAAGQGIGRKTAELFASEGAIVWASDVNEAALTGLEGCRTLRLDVCDAHAIRELPGKTGALDVLVNCAGYVANGRCSTARKTIEIGRASCWERV